MARFEAESGDRKRALELVGEAVDHGQDADDLTAAPELKPLNGDPAFEALVARARENAAKAQ